MTIWTFAIPLPAVLLACLGTCVGLPAQTVDKADFTPVEKALFAHEAHLRRHEAIELLLGDLRTRTARRTKC